MEYLNPALKPAQVEEPAKQPRANDEGLLGVSTGEGTGMEFARSMMGESLVIPQTTDPRRELKLEQPLEDERKRMEEEARQYLEDYLAEHGYYPWERHLHEDQGYGGGSSYTPTRDLAREARERQQYFEARRQLAREAYKERYIAAIRDGAVKLTAAQRAAEEVGDTLFGGLTDEEEPLDRVRFEENLWDRVKDGPGDDASFKLVLREGVSPSQAVISFFQNLQRYRFDCAEALQFLRWHAQIQAGGAQAFNQKIGDRPFELNAHDSTGLTGGDMYCRIDDDEYYEQAEGMRLNGDLQDADAPTLRDQAPVGSRVMWRNWHEDAEETAFENENALKIGEDEYYAHPMGIQNEEDLTLELALNCFEEEPAEGWDTFIATWISIAEIEHLNIE